MSCNIYMIPGWTHNIINLSTTEPLITVMWANEAFDPNHINHIKDLSNCGYRISEISEKTGADPKTIRKYLTVSFPYSNDGCSQVFGG